MRRLIGTNRRVVFFDKFRVVFKRRPRRVDLSGKHLHAFARRRRHLSLGRRRARCGMQSAYARPIDQRAMDGGHMPANTLRDLYQNELLDLYAVEQKIISSLPEMVAA